MRPQRATKSAAANLRRAPITEAVSDAASGSHTGNFVKIPDGACWPPLWFGTVVESVSARVGSWSKAACAMVSKHGLMSFSRAAKTLANGRAADLFLCDVLASFHLHLEHKLHLKRVVEIRDL